MERLNFNLRRQLMLVSILLLSLPWAGCQFIREMEAALRQGQEQSLQATAEAVAAVLGASEQLIYPDPARIINRADSRPSIYAMPSAQFIAVDGYADGWENVPVFQLENTELSAPLSVTYRAVTREKSLLLLLQIRDPQVIYHNPGLSREPNGDRLILRTWQAGKRQEYVIATAAPGSVRARAAGRRMRGTDPGRIQGFWQDTEGGYTLELEIPLSYTGDRLGFYIINAGSSANTPFETLGNITAMETRAPPWLIYSPDDLQSALSPFVHPGRRLEVTDNLRWRVAELEPAPLDTVNSSTFWLLRTLYRSILSEEQLPAPPTETETGKVPATSVQDALAGNPDSARYRASEGKSRTLLAASTPIKHSGRVIGSVVVSQSGEQYLSLTDQAFSRMLGYSLLAITIGFAGLLGYASILSLRIRRLSRAASRVVEASGAISGRFPSSLAADEIGELSRHYARLLERLHEYNEYLRTLSRKLSHELRTPIAIIQTSLENLEHCDDADIPVYAKRARDGLDRLRRILDAMSEASRLEESIRSNSPVTVDLIPLLREVHAAYSELYKPQHIELNIQARQARVHAVPELIIQALDKLMDNAVSFSDQRSPIVISLRYLDDGWELAVRNSGPALSATLSSSLFDPMVSLRGEGGSDVHLGLGLHVVRLIVDYHQGRAMARNTPDGDGVVVSLWLPATTDSAA